jgi:hypothetical protein
MIHHRTRGILRLRLAIECVAVAALFWVWFASYTAIVVAAGPYLAYLAALLAGLVLEAFTMGITFDSTPEPTIWRDARLPARP